MTGRIFDRLTERYGHEAVFMDIDKMPVGVDFRKHLEREFASCRALLVIIGEHWLEADTEGRSRLSRPDDVVRAELEIAQARKIPIVPVVVGRAQMPATKDLPESLRQLAVQNAAFVDPGRDFHHHMDQLIEALDKILPAGALEARSVWDFRGWDFLPLRAVFYSVVAPLLLATLGAMLLVSLNLDPFAHGPSTGETIAKDAGFHGAVLGVTVYYALLMPLAAYLRRKKLSKRSIAVYWAVLLPFLDVLPFIGNTPKSPSHGSQLLLVFGLKGTPVQVALIFAGIVLLSAIVLGWVCRPLSSGELTIYWFGATAAAAQIAVGLVSPAWLSVGSACGVVAGVSAITIGVLRRNSKDVIEQGIYLLVLAAAALGLVYQHWEVIFPTFVVVMMAAGLLRFAYKQGLKRREEKVVIEVSPEDARELARMRAKR
jgi:hypothetical protein